MYLEKYDLSGRVAVVTGGGRAIGLACCHALAEAGARVVIADIESETAAEGQAELVKAGLEVDTVLLDVTRPDQVTAVAGQLDASHGGIDILVNNAGIARSGVKAEEVADEHWLNVIDVNLNGVFWCCRAFGGEMLKRGRGAVVNIGSMSGFIVNKPQQQSFYNASKAAVHHLTRSLAAEWGDRGVRINAVAPTYIETPLTRFRHGRSGALPGLAGEHTHAAGRTARRDRLGGAVPGLGRRQPDDRQHRAGRWGVLLLVGNWGLAARPWAAGPTPPPPGRTTRRRGDSRPRRTNRRRGRADGQACGRPALPARPSVTVHSTLSASSLSGAVPAMKSSPSRR